MDTDRLRQLLLDVQAGRTAPEQAFELLRSLPYEDLGHARIDLHRALRTGSPEVVLCQGKTPQQVVDILRRLWEHHERVLGTRATAEIAQTVIQEIPQAQYDPVSRLIRLIHSAPAPLPPDAPYCLVVCAGTSDLPVAEEAAQVCEFLGDKVLRLYDVGVAGLHRLLDQQEQLYQAEVIISVAGMEGALTSVVAGLVSCPVIGVPTSVGYGASFNGLAALLAMLNSCSPGVAVVNIDNGFGAAQFAHLILSRASVR